VLHDRGQIGVGETLDHVSIIGTHFLGRVEEIVSAGGLPGVVNSVSGRGWVSSIGQYGLDPEDPLPEGYTLPDTWFA
jgi:proline racemase